MAFYLDANAGEPVSQEVLDQFQHWLKRVSLEKFSNPSSSHFSGRKSKSRILNVRDQLTTLLSKDLGLKGEVFFTSSATEATQSVLYSLCERSHFFLLTSQVEHECVLSWLKTRAYKAFYQVPVHSQSGQYQWEFLIKEIEAVRQKGESKILLSLLWANNDTGILQSGFEEKLIRLREKYPEVIFHFDAVQVLGKIPMTKSLKEVLSFSLASFSAAKIGGFSGCGFLWIGSKVQSNIKLLLKEVPFQSGHQEQDKRGGTENWLGISALGFALERLENNSQSFEKTRNIRNSFEKMLITQIENVQIVGDVEERLPNTSRLIINGIDAKSLQMRLDYEGISIGLGSACSSGIDQASVVLKKMGYSDDQAKSSIRVSFQMGEDYPVREIVEILKKNIEILRNQG